MQTDWIDRAEYPFRHNYLDLPMGKMHYIDEGEGDPVLMLHGNPTWSFLYRHFIKGLSKKYRCVAPDLIGFGLSDKPSDWTYLPEEHARNVAALVESLGLKRITLVVQDWGGPIGMSYALDNPTNISRVVVMNTWMWPVNGDPHFERFSGFMGGPVGRFLIKRFNFFVKVLMKKMFMAQISDRVHKQYIIPLQRPNERKGCWVFPRQIIGSGQWLSSLWERRELIRSIPALILWGEKDIAFRRKELERWMGLFMEHRVFNFADAGHFLQEEKGPELVPIIEDFLESTA